MPHGAAMCLLSHLAAIDVRGADARDFLAAQLTSDVARLPAGHSQPAAWCNPQGRVIATLRVVDLGDGFRLVLAADLRERVLERLRMFVLRARVELVSASAVLAGCFGRPAGRAPQALPQQTDATASDGAITFVRMPGAERYLVTGAPAAVRALSAEDPQALPERWRVADIEAGLANVYAATSERFLPQMLGLDRIGGLAFDKGCYPGQEVIARLHYRGGLKRRLYRGTVAGAAPPPAPGSAIVTAAGETAGEVVDAAHAPGGAVRLLAVLADAQAREQLVLECGSTPLELVPAFPSPQE